MDWGYKTYMTKCLGSIWKLALRNRMWSNFCDIHETIHYYTTTILLVYCCCCCCYYYYRHECFDFFHQHIKVPSNQIWLVVTWSNPILCYWLMGYANLRSLFSWLWGNKVNCVQDCFPSCSFSFSDKFMSVDCGCSIYITTIMGPFHCWHVSDNNGNQFYVDWVINAIFTLLLSKDGQEEKWARVFIFWMVRKDINASVSILLMPSFLQSLLLLLHNSFPLLIQCYYFYLPLYFLSLLLLTH